MDFRSRSEANVKQERRCHEAVPHRGAPSTKALLSFDLMCRYI